MQICNNRIPVHVRVRHPGEHLKKVELPKNELQNFTKSYKKITKNWQKNYKKSVAKIYKQFRKKYTKIAEEFKNIVE